ncbi:bactofilin family protein [Novosphingobium percolationis]|uniref:bactofilin family protein n=1 Tax=Novosphingobium percolationis TaxID=2871811 RepID=UPI001CD3912D|nr:polymer-forming cytoskeletal protein [Novosphingobium percolationis]
MADRHTGAFSILGTDIVIRGDIAAQSDLHIDGTIEGDIACAALVQGEASTIRGNIAAKSVRLSGTVHGNIEATELVILKTARIEGDLRYDALTIEHGSRIDGHLARRPTDAEPALTLVG